MKCKIHYSLIPDVLNAKQNKYITPYLTINTYRETSKAHKLHNKILSLSDYSPSSHKPRIILNYKHNAHRTILTHEAKRKLLFNCYSIGTFHNNGRRASSKPKLIHNHSVSDEQASPIKYPSTLESLKQDFIKTMQCHLKNEKILCKKVTDLKYALAQAQNKLKQYQLV